MEHTTDNYFIFTPRETYVLGVIVITLFGILGVLVFMQ